MQYRIQIDHELSQQEWEREASCFMDYSIYQTWAYQYVQASRRKEQLVSIIIRGEEDRVIMMALMRIIQIPIIRLRIGYIRWGPIMQYWKRSELDNTIELFTLIKSQVIPKYVHVIRIVPNVFVSDQMSNLSKNLTLAGYDYVESINPYHTMMFPLDISEDMMSKRIHSKWRATLRKAQKQEMQIIETQDIAYLYTLNSIYLKSQARKGFKGLCIDEFIQTQTLLQDHQKMNLVIVLLGGEPLTIDVTSYLGDTAVGLFQSSSETGLRLGSSYVAWWHALLAAKRAGMKRYDLGGVDPHNNPNVFQFKSRMGAEEDKQIGVYEAYSNKTISTMWKLGQKMYHCVRNA
jgi:lipid II:glycine glycyltransferase (peptidoglycan interpeptide bridge formation enzyme)